MSIYELKRNWKTYQLWTVFRITEDMLTETTTKKYWVAPYNTSYYYSNYEINADAGIARIEWAWYSFDINTKTVASAYRNVRVKIWNWEYIPVMSSSWTILWWSSYFTKANSRIYQYSTKYESWWALHLMTDSNTTYSAMSADEWKTGTATSARSMTAVNLKEIIKYHAGNLHDTTKQDKLTAWEWISIENNVISATSTSAWNMNCITNFGRTRRFWTKTMFNALTEKDVNGVYVILSEKDYQKMIND